MPYRCLLARMRQLFSAQPDPHLGSSAEEFSSGRLRPLIQPMTDRELARAIREFRSAPISDRTLGKRVHRFAKTSNQIRPEGDRS